MLREYRYSPKTSQTEPIAIRNQLNVEYIHMMAQEKRAIEKLTHFSWYTLVKEVQTIITSNIVT